MKRTLIAATVACGLTFGLGATAAGAATPDGAGTGGVPAGIACQQEGVGTLVGAGLIDEAARDGVYVVELDTTFSLREVVALHRTAPGTFTGGLNVTVGEVGPIAASWC